MKPKTYKFTVTVSKARTLKMAERVILVALSARPFDGTCIQLRRQRNPKCPCFKAEHQLRNKP